MTVLISAVSAKLGGAAVYIENLVRDLAVAAPSCRYVVCVPPERATALQGVPSNVTVMPTTVGEQSLLNRFWWDQVTLRRILKRERVSVLYSTANFAMFACPCKQLLLIRMPLYFSGEFLTHLLPRHGRRYRLEFLLRRWICRRSAQAADLVMTPSEAMLCDLRRFEPIPPRRALVNPYGTRVERFADASSERVPDGRLRLLHVSHYADHKNLGVVFRALRLLRRDGVDNLRFITTALVDDPRYPHSVRRTEDRALLEDPEVAGIIEVLGDVSHADLPALYASADCFIFPSLAESFGHPMVEAMASGLPTIAADVPINREILADAAIYFPPFDAEALRLAIARVVEDPVLAEGLRRAARRRAQAFQWKGHVERLAACLRTLEDDAMTLPRDLVKGDRFEERAS